MTHHTHWSIRPATAIDAHALKRLATLDSQPQLSGPTLIAEVDGEPWAAVEITTGRTIADPFRPSRAIARAAHARAQIIGRRCAKRRLVRPVLARFHRQALRV